MIVVNFSTKEFIRGQKRLAESLNGTPFLSFTSYNEIGSPTHQQSPYEFKIHAIKKAFERDDIVLWADSSMVLKGDISRIEKIIINDGYFMEEAGHYVDRWCNNHARKYFNLKEGSGYIMFSAGLLGLNKKSPHAMEWFYKWEQSAEAGCFSGDWSNHRHDMTCGSIIAQRMGFKYQTGASHLCYVGPGYQIPHEDVVFTCQGI